MAVIELCNGILAGLTADTKPTTYPNGTMFFDTQTGAYWMYISAVWTLVGGLGTPLSVANGGTGATTLTGVVIGTGTTAMTVKTNPTGAFVGTTDTQNLSGKTMTAPIYDSFNEHNVVTAPASPAANKVRIYAKQVDANNDGYFIKEKINGAVVEVQIS